MEFGAVFLGMSLSEIVGKSCRAQFLLKMYVHECHWSGPMFALVLAWVCTRYL